MSAKTAKLCKLVKDAFGGLLDEYDTSQVFTYRSLASLLRYMETHQYSDKNAQEYQNRVFRPLWDCLDRVNHVDQATKTTKLQLVQGQELLNDALNQLDARYLTNKVYLDFGRLHYGKLSLLIAMIIHGRKCTFFLMLPGTKSLHEAWLDFQTKLTNLTLFNSEDLERLAGPHPDIQVHYGMYKYFRYISENAVPKLTRIVLDVSRKNHIPPANFKFVVVGHSLGGAVANLLAMTLRWSVSPNISVFTFSSPRLGNKGFCELLASPGFKMQRYFRIYNNKDFIASQPPRKRKYLHVDEYLESHNQRIIDYRSVDLQETLPVAVQHLILSASLIVRIWYWHTVFAFRSKDRFKLTQMCEPAD